MSWTCARLRSAFDVIALHTDRRLSVHLQSDELPWLPSPEPGVARRMLEREGGEVARATSLVRYAPGSRFGRHVHELGEEFLVLSGVFSDEHGDYPAGTYVRNPPGSAHAPASAPGCMIFVKLRQMAAADEARVCLRENELGWQAGPQPGRLLAPLWAGHGEQVYLERLGAGMLRPPYAGPGGEEILLLAGTLSLLDEPEAPSLWRPGAWWRDAQPRQAARAGPDGAKLWVKRGHLPRTDHNGT
jgi:quercetin dioxygenase-like cupin family protein